MRQKEKKKACWSCDSDVSIHATYCPFCGTDLMQMQQEISEEEVPAAPQESLASLYTPPYPSRNRVGVGIPDERKESNSFTSVQPNTQQPFYPDHHDSEEVTKVAGESTDIQIDNSSGIWPILLLCLGTNLFTLGLLLFFLSDDGVLTLEWNSYAWFLYCICALPLLFFGFKMLKFKKESSRNT